MRGMNFYKGFLMVILLCTISLFCGCGKKQDEQICLKFSVFDNDGQLNEIVEKFNASHENVVTEIELRERNTDIFESDFEGIDRMKREIVTGSGPDIIDFGPLFSMTDIVGDYTIDLSSYLQQSDLNLAMNLIQSFSIDGAQRCIPTNVMILSMEIPNSRACGRESWTLDELITEYNQFRVDDTKMLFYGECKLDVFSMLLSFNMNAFIDWENKTCFFDGEEFRNLLLFCDTFQDTFDFEHCAPYVDCYRNGDAFLLLGGIESFFDICVDQYLFGEEISYIGYPVNDGNGNLIENGDHMLAISSSCEYPDIAWEFLQMFLTEEYQEQVKLCPVNWDVIDSRIKDATTLECDNSTGAPLVKYSTYVGECANPIEITQMKPEEAEKIRNLIRSVEQSTGMDWRIYRVIHEEVQAFFTGDKTLEDVCNILQSIVSLYVYELE